MQNKLPPNATPKHSTGPRTRAGKVVVARNAILHGMGYGGPVIPGIETEADWHRHRDGIIESLAPEGRLERTLAERVALLIWRLDRVTRYEVAVTHHSVAKTRSDLAAADAYLQGTLSKGELPEVDDILVTQAEERRVIPDVDELDKIMRYEAHLYRQCVQTLHELEALQARRNGQQTHLARLDISSSPSMFAFGGRRLAPPRDALRP